MATVIGSALLWMLGNFDLDVLLISFTLGIGFISALFEVWHCLERGRDV